MRKQIGEYIKLWGGPVSISLLDPKCTLFQHPNIEGAIGYYKVGNISVVYGNPVCALKDRPKLATAFHDFNTQNGCQTIYLAASESFSKWAMNHVAKSMLEVEEELVIDPALYPKKGSKGRLLHKKLNHAVRDGVIIKEFMNDNDEIKKHILDVEEQWLTSKKGPQIYIAHINFFDEHAGKRCFYATQNGKFVGAIFLSRMESKNGWLLYLLMTVKEAPVGTSEYLVMTVLDKLAEEKCSYFSFGIATLEKVGKTSGLTPLSSLIAKFGFQMAKKFFPLDNRRKFWEKFDPYNKHSFTLFSKSSIGIKELIAIMKTTNVSF